MTQANAFFQVVNRRYENRSATIVTTKGAAGDAVVAAAILDRLLNGAAVINIREDHGAFREHQALTQPLAHLNDPPETLSRRRR